MEYKILKAITIMKKFGENNMSIMNEFKSIVKSERHIKIAGEILERIKAAGHNTTLSALLYTTRRKLGGIEWELREIV